MKRVNGKTLNSAISKLHWRGRMEKLSDKNISIFFIHGNRDFLIGESFAEETGCHILHDPHVIDLYGKKVLISHGDIFCTDDKKYQSFRNQTRDPEWKKSILSKPACSTTALSNCVTNKSESLAVAIGTKFLISSGVIITPQA